MARQEFQEPARVWIAVWLADICVGGWALAHDSLDKMCDEAKEYLSDMTPAREAGDRAARSSCAPAGARTLRYGCVAAAAGLLGGLRKSKGNIQDARRGQV